MTCTTCKKQEFPFETIYEQVLRAFCMADLFGEPIAPVVAICICESYGTAYFPNKDNLLSVNSAAMSYQSGVAIADFLRLIQIQGAGHIKIVPKFRFEKAWFDLINENKRYAPLSPVEKALLACSIGLGQKSMYFYTHDLALEDMVPAALKFAAEPWLQIIQIVCDLKNAGWNGGTNFELAASKYNQGNSCKVVTEYGKRAESFRYSFTKKLIEKGIAECSPNKSKTSPTPSLPKASRS